MSAVLSLGFCRTEFSIPLEVFHPNVTFPPPPKYQAPLVAQMEVFIGQLPFPQVIPTPSFSRDERWSILLTPWIRLLQAFGYRLDLSPFLSASSTFFEILWCSLRLWC
ncbi:hypothetical protein VNO77_38888 [Canavalia gladiata]|uniref:Uncharacterized protein n=1 Tax=Canavalia gladiata TaxID=3824 RepID=A0AAN9KA19_CANGL